MKKILFSLTFLAGAFYIAKAQIGPCSGTPMPVITAQYAPACAGHNDTIYANAFLTKGLVAYYPFNGNANDLSGNGYNATTVGVSLTADRFGNPNKCYNFAGTSTYVQCPAATYFTGGDYTISGWVNVSNVDSWARLIDFGNCGGCDNVLVALSAGTSYQLDANNDGGSNFTSGQVLGTNAWVQVLFTYDAASQVSTCYYNGTAIDSGSIPPPNNVVRNNCYIGLSNWGGDGGVFGMMDDIRIYNRELNSSEISQLYNYESTGESQTTYTWSGGSTVPYIVSNSATPTTTTYTLTQMRDGASCSAADTLRLATVNCTAALNFDGSNDFVDAGNNIDNVIQNTNLLTVEAWVNPSTTNNLGVIAGNFNTQADGSMQFLLRRDGSNYTFWVNNAGFNAVASVSTVTTNVWQHVAGTWDGSNLNIYINGVLDNSAPNVTGTFGAEANNVWLGKDNSNEYFGGSMDEVMLWNVARTQAQIQSDMSCLRTSTPTGLVAYYNFDQGIANQNNAGTTTLTDITGNGNDGTLTNFALTGTTSNWVNDASQVGAVPSITSVVTSNTLICSGTTVTLTVNGNANNFTWGANAGSATTTTVNINPTATATYVVTAANNLCKVMDSVSVNVNASPTISSQSGNVNACGDVSGTFSVNTTGSYTYTWYWAPVGSPTDPNDANVDDGSFGETGYTTNSFTMPGLMSNGWGGYFVFCVVTNTNNCSAISNPDTINVYSLPPVGVSTSTNYLCIGSTATLSANNANTYTWSTTDVGAIVAVSPTVTATYTVTGMDGNGCVNTATQLITVNPLPTLTVTVNTATICAGNTVTLTTMGASTYTLTNTNATGTTFIATPTTTTQYTITGTDGNGCINNDTLSVMVENCTTGLNKVAGNSNTISIYPNPSNGSFVIEAATLTNANVMMYDINGKLVLSQTINEKAIIDATNLNNGAYNISIISEEGIVNKRIVITR